jgi:ribulose-5-phosphate 4-epimerase/fuculose-1-phosphate aldolase
MFPGVQSVIHSHCLSAIVYGLCNSWNSMLQPSYLMAGFLGTSPPIFDIARFYDYLPQTYPRNLLISNQFLGDAMAEMLRKSQDEDMRLVEGPTNLPEQKVVFQRGHGYTTWAQSLQDAVWRAIHVRRDADIQTAAMSQRESTDLEVVYLSEREAKDCEMTINRADKKHWLAWVAEAYRSGMYHNDLRDRLGAG